MEWVTRGEGGSLRFRVMVAKSMTFVVRKRETSSSLRHPTELGSFQEMLKRLQDRHVECAQAVAKKAAADAASAATVSLDAQNVLQAMM